MLLSSDCHLWPTPVAIERILKRVERDATAVNRGDEPREPIHIHKLQQRLGERQLLELIRLYEGGMAASALAKRYGIGKSSVLRVLHERGVTVRARGRYW